MQAGDVGSAGVGRVRGTVEAGKREWAGAARAGPSRRKAGWSWAERRTRAELIGSWAGLLAGWLLGCCWVWGLLGFLFLFLLYFLFLKLTNMFEFKFKFEF